MRTHTILDALEMKESTTMAQHEVELDDFNSHIFNDEDDISKAVDSSVLEQPTHMATESQ